MIRSLCSAVLLLAVLAGPAVSQAVRGQLSSPGGEPVPAAFLTLLHESGAAERATLSDAQGNFRLETGSSGRFILRVERPGYAPYATAPFVLDSASTLTLNLAVSVERVGLGEVRSASVPCVPAIGGTGRIAELWQQAARSLRIMAFAEETGMLEVGGVHYVRLLDRGGYIQQGIIDQEPFAGRVVPYPAPPTHQLPAGGFATADSTGATVFFMASPAVMLSEAFLDTHCFHRILLERKTPERVGLAFKPAHRSGAVGIEGVLWLDPGTAQVRTLEYEYRDRSGDLPRGTRALLGFSPFTGGVPGVSRWWLRVPRVFETRFYGGTAERNTSIVESGAIVFGPDETPLDDPDGVFAMLRGMFKLNPIMVQAERAQQVMSEGALTRIRVDEMLGAPTTDAWDIVRSLRPTWLARAQAPKLSEESSGGDVVVYLDRMRLSTLNGNADDSSFVSSGDALAQIPAAWIASIEYIPPIEAAAIYGMGHGYGVIVIRSRRQ